jgi:hypothetical protein
VTAAISEGRRESRRARRRATTTPLTRGRTIACRITCALVRTLALGRLSTASTVCMLLWCHRANSIFEDEGRDACCEFHGEFVLAVEPLGREGDRRYCVEWEEVVAGRTELCQTDDGGAISSA